MEDNVEQKSPRGKTGNPVSRPTNEGKTALMMASKQGHKNIAASLLQRKHIDVNKTDLNGRTALMESAVEGYADIVKMILESDTCAIDINCGDGLDGDGWTALILAAW